MNTRSTHSRQRAWQLRSPEKFAAHKKVAAAVLLGFIERPSSCSACQKAAPVHGHHDDYSRPLSVRWLCAQCHADTHAKRVAVTCRPLTRVHGARCARGVSQYRLAREAKTTPSHIARIERGESCPSVDLALRIADALGADVRELFPVRERKAA